jgi:chitinase
MPVDGTQGCIRAFTQLKPQYSKMKVILSVGGGGKGSENFALVARSQSRTETFVRTARALVDQFGLDGLDSIKPSSSPRGHVTDRSSVDWEHPADPQQGMDYVRLLAKLREALPAPRYILATCLPAGQWALRNIDLSKAQLYLDLINLMAYDFAGPWTNESGHHAQLYSPSRNPGAASCQSCVQYVMSQGVDPKKLLLGVPAYGRSFLGSEKPGQRYIGSGGEDGVFDYSDLPRPGAKEHHDEKLGAAYCSGGDGGFVSYDTPRTVQQKARFVTKTKLGGLFYWHIGGDARGPRSLIETGYNTLHEM